MRVHCFRFFLVDFEEKGDVWECITRFRSLERLNGRCSGGETWNHNKRHFQRKPQLRKRGQVTGLIIAMFSFLSVGILLSILFLSFWMSQHKKGADSGNVLATSQQHSREAWVLSFIPLTHVLFHKTQLKTQHPQTLCQFFASCEVIVMVSNWRSCFICSASWFLAPSWSCCQAFWDLDEHGHTCSTWKCFHCETATVERPSVFWCQEMHPKHFAKKSFWKPADFSHFSPRNTSGLLHLPFVKPPDLRWNLVKQLCWMKVLSWKEIEFKMYHRRDMCRYV